jgi:hypothetical protein
MARRPDLKDGSYWATDNPGFGIDLAEKRGAKLPITHDRPIDYRWGNLRCRDHAVTNPRVRPFSLLGSIPYSLPTALSVAESN